MSDGGQDTLDPRRRPLLIAGAAAVVVAIGVVTLAWHLTHVPPLPVSRDRVTATTTVGVPIYVGVFAVPADVGHEIEIRNVSAPVTASVSATVVALVCVGGSIGVTTAPTTFCARLAPAAGSTLRPGDDLVLEVTADDPGAVVIDRVEISYHQGWRRGTQPAGAPSVVRVLAR